MKMPFYQTTFHDINLLEICKKLGHSLDDIAGPEVYSSAYSALKKEDFFDIDESFISRRHTLAKWTSGILQQHNVNKVLSVGCGTAVLEDVLSSLGYVVHLQECQSDSLEYLKKINRKSNNKKFSIIDSNLENIKPNSFDCVVSFSSSYFFDDESLLTFFQSIKNVLRKGGIFILYDNSFNVHHLFLRLYWALRRTKHAGVKWGYKRTFSNWNKFALKCGFENQNEVFFDIENVLSSTSRLFGMPVKRSVVWQAAVYKLP